MVSSYIGTLWFPASLRGSPLQTNCLPGPRGATRRIEDAHDGEVVGQRRAISVRHLLRAAHHSGKVGEPSLYCSGNSLGVTARSAAAPAGAYGHSFRPE
jgi:hypothetical protein